jgi:uncharacterized membrane protein YfcA
MHPNDLILYACAALLIAGTIKGFVGLGLPAIAIALLAFRIETREAVALVIMPMFVSNFWQYLRGPDRWGTVQRHWRYGVVICLVVAGMVFVSQDAPDRLLRAVLGALVLLFCLLSWRNLVPVIPEHRIRLCEFLSAFVSGLVGGLTAIWAPTLAAYLSARQLDRDEFIQAFGFLVTAGSIGILLTYPSVGFASGTDFLISTALLVPTLLGFTLGEALRKRADPAIFRAIFLVAFALVGVNLLVRATLL